MRDPGDSLDQMRRTAPLVHNITNFVAMNIMANVLLAAGASPAMVHAREEAAEFAGLAQALTINIGTVSPDWAIAMEDAAKAAGEHGIPWVLDPVAVGATRYRRDLGARLATLNPIIIRGNASEIMALAGLQATGKGADTGDTVANAHEAARALARQAGAVVAVTGPVDFVTDGRQAAQVSNGHAMMPRVTALGCALTGIIAAFAAEQDPFDATVGALSYYGIAGERAGATTQGPGAFQTAFIDALFLLSSEEVSAMARISLS